MQSQPTAQEIAELIDQLHDSHLAKKQQLLDSIGDAIIWLNPDLSPILTNQQLSNYLAQTKQDDFPLNQLEIYSQKHTRQAFNLIHWLNEQQTTLHETVATTPLLWIKRCDIANDKCAVSPVLIKAHPVFDQENQLESILLFIQDQSLKIQAEAQIRLMESSSAGQFITDAHGYITQPNYAFAAYTQLSNNELANMTYIDWLKQQVIFREPFGKVMEALLETNSWNGEVQININENAFYHAVLSLSMLTDENRNIEHFVGVLQDITDIHEAQKEITQLAYYDRLTGLPNRTLLHNQIEETLNGTEINYSGLILLDLDSFKIINDTLGHAIGDQLLILVAKKVREFVPERYMVARLDGDEFAIFTKHISQDPTEALTQLLGLAYKLVEVIDSRYAIEGRSLHCTASLGVYLFNQNVESGQSDEIIRYANMALHEAKNLGGNQVFQFEDQLNQNALQRLEMLQALNHSDLDNEFQLYFQAQVDKNGKAMAAETLLRWFHPKLGFVSPGDFIPVAEEGRQIIKIGLWVLHKAFLQAKYWNENFEPIRLSINISPVQFHEQSFVELIIGLVKFTQVNPNYITLELTEGVLIRNTELALQKIQHLVSLGFHISIDDFGTGYSSLSYLQKLPIHELKIDQCFIQHISDNIDDKAIVDSILSLAKNKSLLVIAEGVETEQQAAYLHQQQSNLLIQGYLYSQPCPASEFEARFLTLREDKAKRPLAQSTTQQDITAEKPFHLHSAH